MVHLLKEKMELSNFVRSKTNSGQNWFGKLEKNVRSPNKKKIKPVFSETIAWLKIYNQRAIL